MINISIPPERYFSTLSRGDLIYFVNGDIDSPEPHYHIIVLKDDEQKYLLTICTSKVKRRMEIFEKLNKPFETLVIINPDAGNGLTMESAVDCNSYFYWHENVLFNIYNTDSVKYKGKLQEGILQQIADGLVSSDEVEQDVKELVKKHYPSQ